MKLPSIVRVSATRMLTGRRWPVPAPGFGLRWRVGLLWSAITETFEAELDERRGFLWLAVAFAAGALVYLSLPGEPSSLALFAATLSASAFAWSGWRRGARWRLLVVLAAILAGMTAGKVRVLSLEGPTLARTATVDFSGRVVDRDSRTGKRPRITLDQLHLDALPPGERPARIRISLAPTAELPPLGARISLRARLAPIPGPAVPGAYDPRQAGFFAGLGGTGFALGAWTLAAPAEGLSADLFIAGVRNAMVERIMAVLPGEAGAVAAALLVGERGALSEDTNESLRLSGLAHILSISGLHMMLISGCAFFAARALLAFSPTLALRYPIRKWAALAAIVVISAYFTLSGGGAATLRSYVMALIMFAAILLDRPAISMRNLALALFVVVATEPESVVEPGFQMSFAAVAALIAGWEAWSGRKRASLADDDAIPGFWLLRKAGRALVGVALTTIVASLATAPFGAYHFERIASYALLGNIFAAPLVSAIIMPSGLLALVAMPFGLESLPLTVMASGIHALLAVSGWVAGLSGAEIRAPALTGASLLIITGGFLWLCLWRRRWRFAGLVVVACGALLNPLFRTHPDILITADGRSVAVRDGGGVLRLSGSRAGSFVAEQIYEKEAELPTDSALQAGVTCDALACILAGRGGLEVAHVRDPAAFLEDCARADVVVTPLAAPASCSARRVIDRNTLLSTGAQVLHLLATNPPMFRTVAERRALPRPWQRTGPADPDEAPAPRLSSAASNP